MIKPCTHQASTLPLSYRHPPSSQISFKPSKLITEKQTCVIKIISPLIGALNSNVQFLLFFFQEHVIQTQHSSKNAIFLIHLFTLQPCHFRNYSTSHLSCRASSLSLIIYCLYLIYQFLLFLLQNLFLPITSIQEAKAERLLNFKTTLNYIVKT